MGLTSIVFFGKKDKKACCPACAAEMEAKQIVRKPINTKRRKV